MQAAAHLKLHFEEPILMVASLASVTEHDGTLYVVCFSDDGPDTVPHPVSEERAKSGVQPQQWMECRHH